MEEDSLFALSIVGECIRICNVLGRKGLLADFSLNYEDTLNGCFFYLSAKGFMFCNGLEPSG